MIMAQDVKQEAKIKIIIHMHCSRKKKKKRRRRSGDEGRGLKILSIRTYLEYMHYLQVNWTFRKTQSRT